MSRLYEKLRPESIDDIVGQPAIVRAMKTFLLEPYPTAMLYVGGSGVGKTSLAMAMSNALADRGWFGSSEYYEIGANFKTEKAEYYFGNETPFRYALSRGKYSVLRIEELERLPQNVQGNLKEAIEDFCRRYRLIIIATSNDTSALEKAFLHRFTHYRFDAGPEFASAFNEWLRLQWLLETGQSVPKDLPHWGYDMDQVASGDIDFSARLALDRMEACLLARKEVTVQ